MKPLKLSIIIPTYNERENIEEVVKKVENSLKEENFEIIIVDDNSPDGTGKIADELANRYDNIKVIHRYGQRGLASAVKEGMKYAYGEYICVMDADLQHPPELIREMLKRTEKSFDLVIASRYIKGGGIKNWSLVRRVISLVAVLFARTLISKASSVKDPVSGYFLFKRNKIDNSELHPIGYKILIEILAKGKFTKVAEVPYVFVGRKVGKSKLSFEEYFNYVKHLLTLFIKIG